MNYSLWLNELPGIGIKKVNLLLTHFYNAEGIFHATRQELEKVKGIHSKDVETILYRRNPAAIEKKESNLSNKQITFVSREDTDYPKKLRELYDSPYGIYVKGRLPKEEERLIAMVGARMCSTYGRSMAREIAKALGENKVAVVSGMARGIDGYSHEGCLNAGGATFAIVAGGVDVIYPSEHQQLYERILTNGGVISEYPPGTQPKPGMFPRRNRLISGLSEATILVEAKKRSGSLITADFALEQGKDVYAVPGRVNDPLSEGCNNYIKQGAGIIDSIRGLLEELDLTDYSTNKHEKNKTNLLEKEESMVYSCLRLTPCSIEELMLETNLDLLCVIRCISRLVEMGLAEEYYKNYYIRST